MLKIQESPSSTNEKGRRNLSDKSRSRHESFDFTKKELLLVLLVIITTLLGKTEATAQEEELKNFVTITCQSILHEQAPTPEFDSATRRQFVCSDNKSFELLTYFRNLEIRDSNNPPDAEDITFLEANHNFNFNCHSYTLQNIQTQLGIDLGVDRSTWVEQGLETFVRSFSTLQFTSTIPDRSGREAFVSQFTNLSPDKVHIALYFDNSGNLIHSGIILDSGREVGKFGPSEVVESDTWYPAWKYLLDDPENPGYVEVYDIDKSTQIDVLSAQSTPTSETIPTYPASRSNHKFFEALTEN